MFSYIVDIIFAMLVLPSVLSPWRFDDNEVGVVTGVGTPNFELRL